MKKGFFYGTPDGSEELVLEVLSNTKVNSFKTSSIPFTEFWISRNDKLSKKLISEIGLEIDLENSQKCFEYPVYATKIKNGKIIEIGRPSMTDLMILTDKYNIAIEGKFTEDLYETVSEWLKGASENSEKNDVLRSWYNYIKDYCNLEEADMEMIENKVVYQFIHRTASACYGCKETGKIPVVLYQLFYDKNNPKSEKHQTDIAKKIREFASLLKFDESKIKFYVLLTPITNFSEVKEKYSWAKADLFSLMKNKAVYKFD